MGEPAWRRSAVEAPLAPDIPIIDAHHHLWDEGMSADRFGRFEPEDFVAEIDRGGHRIVASVFLQCHWSYRKTGPEVLHCVGETERVEAVASQFAARGGAHGDLVAAIVSGADLTLGDAVDEVLEAHLAASPTRFRGIRDGIAADPDQPFGGDRGRGKSSDPRFRAGLARLQRYDLTFDVWCVHPQLDELAELARAFPDTTMILNHLATPIGVGRFAGKQAEVFAAWRAGIERLALCPNVVIKLGGLGMGFTGYGWGEAPTPPDSETVAAAYSPYVLHAVDAFSPARCMFESNFPVDGEGYGYGVLWNAFKRVAARFSADEQRQLFHDTAARVYRIGPFTV